MAHRVKPGALAAALALVAGGAAAQPATTADAENNAPAVPVRAVYRVLQQGGGLGMFVDEAAVFHAVGQGAARVWVVEHRRRDQRMGVATYRYDWIDGRTCPALVEVIAGIGRLEPVAMAGADIDAKGWVSDSADTTVIGPPAGGMAGDAVLRRDLHGPVSRWWRAAGTALEGCWQPRMPYVAGAYDLRPRLTSARDEVEVMRP